MPSARVAGEWPSAAVIPSEPLGFDGGSKEATTPTEPPKSSPESCAEPAPEKCLDADVSAKADSNRELVKRLIARRCGLEEALLAKLDELKRLCVSEGELTGELPKEIFATLLPGEDEPRVQRRVGTTFKFSQEQLEQLCMGRESTDRLTQLEADIQLHRKIVAAAERLAGDKNTNKSVRKKRRKDFQAAAFKLKAMERGLQKLRMAGSRSELLMSRSVSIAPSAPYDTISSTSSSATASAPTTMIACGGGGGNRAMNGAGLMSREASGSGFSLHSLKSWSTSLVASSSHAFKGSTKSVPEMLCSTAAASTSANAIGDERASQSSFPTADGDLAGSPLPASSAITSPTRLFGGKKRSPRLSLSAQAKSHKSSMTASTSTTSSSSAGTGSSVSSGFFSRLSSMASVNNHHHPNNHLKASLLPSPPPAIPARRSPVSRTPSGRMSNSNGHTGGGGGEGYCFGIAIRDSPEYANIGYTTSAPYKSAYRQSNFPTIAASRSSSCSSSVAATSFPAGARRPSTAASDKLSCSSLLSSPPPRFPTPAHLAHLRAPQLLLASFSSRGLIGRPSGPVGTFSTSSLDRRAMHATSPAHRVQGGELSDQLGQQSTHFPVKLVADNRPCVVESAAQRPPMDLRRFGKSISASTAVTNGKNAEHAYLPMAIDPQMERLLASIHNRSATATRGGAPPIPPSSATAI